jgi:translation initiation factor 3 subunit B
MEWSPSDNIISYWVPEKDNIPSSVVLMEIPSRKMVRERHFYNVCDIKLTWQNNGDYLCLGIARRKTKKTIIHNFEIFRMRQKNIPVEVLELDDNIVKFSFEPKGHRFAVIHGNAARPSVSFHRLKKKTLELIKTIENRPANDVFWSPSGEHVVLAGLGDKNGCLEFFNSTNMQSVCETEHHMATDLEWDPSGRYVITSITQFIDAGTNWRAAMENGYKVWSAHGTLLHTINIEMLYQVLFRPRPKSLLSKDMLANIQDGLKEKYWKKFEAEDEEIRFSQQSAEQKERLKLKNDWKTYRAEREAEFASEATYRINLRFGLLSDDEDDYVETEVITEEEISNTTTVLEA